METQNLPKAHDMARLGKTVSDFVSGFDLPMPTITFQVGKATRRKIDEELFYRADESHKDKTLDDGDVVVVNYKGVEIRFV